MKLNIKIYSALMFFFCFTASSCLKDKNFNNGSIQSVHSTTDPVKVIELAVATTNSNNYLSYYVDNSDNDTIVDLIPVTLATKDLAPTDLHVTLIQNDQAVTDYNAANTDTTATVENPNPTGTIVAYEVPTSFTIVNPVVTIPKGQRTGYFQIKFKPSDFLNHDYALGFSISKIDESGYSISGNLQTAVVSIGIKNKYDGNYRLSLTTSGWAAYGIADDDVARDYGAMQMLTNGANSLIYSGASNGNNQPAFASAGSKTSFGAAIPEFTFDLATDKLLSIANLQPDSRNRRFSLDPAHPSSYNPSTKTLDLYYIMDQNGRPSQFIHALLTYVGPR